MHSGDDIQRSISGKKRTKGGNVFLDAGIYTFSNIILKALNFLLLPLYTAYLTSTDYGITSIIASFTSVAGILMMLSINNAVMRMYVDVSAAPEKKKEFISTLFTFALLSGVIGIAILTLARGLLTRLFFEGIPFFPIVIYALIGLVAGNVYTLYLSYLRVQQKAMNVATLTISYFFLEMGFNILMIVVFKMGAEGYVLATMLGNAAFALYILVRMSLSGEYRPALNWSYLSASLKYSVPLIPHELSAQIKQLISKTILKQTNTLASVGLYNIASQIGGVTEILMSSFHSAFLPWFYQRMKATKGVSERGDIAIKYGMFTQFSLLCSVALALFSKEACLLLLPNSYREAWPVIPLIASTYSMKTIYYCFISVLFFNKAETRKIFLATLTGAGINVAVAYFAIPIWGMYGSVLAEFVAMVVRIFMIVWFARHQEEDAGFKLNQLLLGYLLSLCATALALIPDYIWDVYAVSAYKAAYKLLVLFVYAGFLLKPHWKKISAVVWRKKNSQDKETQGV